MTLAYTPYDGSGPLFKIGLKPMELPGWLEIDELLIPYLAEKNRLFATLPEKIFAAEEGTEDAQAEVLELAVEHLLRHFPETYKRVGDAIEITDHDRKIELQGDAPLKIASLLVQEDLVIMRRGDDGWRLAAASLCFPSSWRLAEKFRKPIDKIHTPVPGFGSGTRNASLIERIFDKLAVDLPIERMNWSLQLNSDLYHPLSDMERDARASDRSSRFGCEDLAASLFIRVERQTLRRLAKTGDILFTIRIYLDPMTRLRAHPDREQIAAAFADQMLALDEDQLDYKGFTADRDMLVSSLRQIAAS